MYTVLKAAVFKDRTLLILSLAYSNIHIVFLFKLLGQEVTAL